MISVISAEKSSSKELFAINVNELILSSICKADRKIPISLNQLIPCDRINSQRIMVCQWSCVILPLPRTSLFLKG